LVVDNDSSDGSDNDIRSLGGITHAFIEESASDSV